MPWLDRDAPERFDADWLALREPADARARSDRLAGLLSAALPARPRLIDLGAGSGSLFRWLAPRLGRAQAWTLVDADSDLIARAFDEIAEWAVTAGFGVSAPSRTALLVHTERGAWRVEGRIADLRDAPDGLALEAADAVLCSALCDLVSRRWVGRMAAALRVPFYAAQNVDGRDRFLPAHPADAPVARGFRRDQRRDKGFGGIALGADAPRALAEAFRARGFAVHGAATPWRLGPADRALLRELVAGHALAAIPWLRRPEQERIAGWAAVRRAQALRGRLRATVGHADILALPRNLPVPGAASGTE